MLTAAGCGCAPDAPGGHGEIQFVDPPEVVYPEHGVLFQESGYVVANVTWVDSQTMVVKPAEGVSVVDTAGGWVLVGHGQ